MEEFAEVLSLDLIGTDPSPSYRVEISLRNVRHIVTVVFVNPKGVGWRCRYTEPADTHLFKDARQAEEFILGWLCTQHDTPELRGNFQRYRLPPTKS